MQTVARLRCQEGDSQPTWFSERQYIGQVRENYLYLNLSNVCTLCIFRLSSPRPYRNLSGIVGLTS